jgi:hypothetical protein
MNELNFKKNLAAIRRQIGQTKRLQVKLESHLAKIDLLQARLDLKRMRKPKSKKHTTPTRAKR